MLTATIEISSDHRAAGPRVLMTAVCRSTRPATPTRVAMDWTTAISGNSSSVSQPSP